MSEKYYISWQDFHRDVKNLADKIRVSGNYSQIIAVSRGGLLPAGILAYELDIRKTQTINMSSYDHNYERRRDEDIELECHIDVVDEHTLIVDDLADTGRTFQILRKKFPQAHFACVYAKPQGGADAGIFARALPEQWIVFPWDVE